LLVLVYNEREMLEAFYDRLRRVLDGLARYDQELIFVDDGSTDGSFEILRYLRGGDPRVRILRLSRNFGSWNAVAAGVDAASGDAVAWLTSDLQDPPELLPQLVQRWEEGADVVWAVRAGRDDPLLRRVAATIFYRFLRRVALPNYPPAGMDICLLDRRVAQIFARLKDRHRFTQALVMQLGFTQVQVPYWRQRRHHGRSKWGHFARLCTMGIDMIVAVSPWPFRAMTSLGLFLLLPGMLFLAVGLGRALLGKPVLPQWVVAVAAVAGIVGLNATMLGVLGEYVWRILEGVRDRPLYIVQERIGFEPPAPLREGAPGHRASTWEQT
jgi:dolichol-phosphate mannosyltransferase